MFSGGTDNAGCVFDVTTGQTTKVAQHDAPIKVVKWVDAPQTGILATGSWDKTIKVSVCLSASTVMIVTHARFASTGICGHRRQLQL